MFPKFIFGDEPQLFGVGGSPGYQPNLKYSHSNHTQIGRWLAHSKLVKVLQVKGNMLAKFKILCA